MVLVFTALLAFLLGSHAQMPVPTIRNTAIEDYNWAIGGYERLPRCHYESCKSPDSCHSSRAQKNSNTFTQYCFCDKNCLLYGDCCFDFFETCMESNILQVAGHNTLRYVPIVEDSEEDLKTVLQQQEMLAMKECVDVTVDDVVYNYWFVSRCPNNTQAWEDDILDCELKNRTFVGSVPVTLTENPTITFANRHCAACHGVTRQVRFWHTEASCFDMNLKSLTFSDITKYLTSGNCTLNVRQNVDDSPRTCTKNVSFVSSVLNSSTQYTKPLCSFAPLTQAECVHDLCSLYSYPVMDIHSVTYKNPHCAYIRGGEMMVNLPLRCVQIKQLNKVRYPTPTPGNFPQPTVNSGATPYLGPGHYPIGYTPYPGATPYLGPTPYPIGYTPYPGATPYPGPTPYPIGYTPYPGATPYLGPTPYPIGYTPYPGAKPYPGPTPYPIGYTPYLGATPYPGPTHYPIGFIPYPGATPYLGPTPYPIGYTPSSGVTPYPSPIHKVLSNVPMPGSTLNQLHSSESISNKASIPTKENGPSVSSFKILFNFGDEGMSFSVNGQEVKENTICPREDEVYLPYSQRCVKLRCDGTDTRPVNGTCRLKDKVLVNGTRQLYPDGTAMFIVSFQIEGPEKLIERHMRRFGTLLKERVLNNTNNDLQFKLNKIRTFSHTQENSSIQNMIQDETNLYEYELTFYTNMNASNFINTTIQSADRHFYMKLKHYNLTTTQFKLRNFKTKVDGSIRRYTEYLQETDTYECPNGTFPNLHLGVDLVSVQETYYARLSRMYYKLDNIIFQIFLKERLHSLKSVDVVVCAPREPSSILHCPNGSVNLLPSEFRREGDSLILIPNELKLSAGNFTLTADGASVCNIFSRKIIGVSFFDYNHVQTVLTVVTSSVSISSLVVLLVIYCSLRELRNVPGKIVMCLSLTLLLAQAFQLLINIPTGWMCTAVASLVHITWLSSFMWMSILSIDLARSIRSMSPVAGVQSHSKLFCLYAGLAWFLPVLFVATCVLVDYFSVWDIVIGYGSDHLCWISNPRASLYIFGLPVAMTLLVNVVCFFLTLTSIERTTQKMSSKSKSCRNEKTRLGIYVRLSFIMGFAWIFCFVAAFVRMTLLWYFQIALNGLQGFYIFVCFVCKSRILKMLVEKYQLPILKSRMKEPSTTTSTSNGE